MKSFIQTLKNIYKIEELRSRIFFTLFIILIYRLGSKIVLPGVDPAMLEALPHAHSREYLDCSICFREVLSPMLLFLHWVLCPIFQHPLLFSLLTIAVPYFQRMQKEGESGRQKNEPDYTVSDSTGAYFTGSCISYTDSRGSQDYGHLPCSRFPPSSFLLPVPYL